MAEPPPPRMNWLKRHVPTRDTIHRYRLLRPFARHLSNPALWRMTRRSVPRAVALGLFVGVIFPFMHFVLAAILAIPARANVAIAAAVAFLTGFAAPPVYYAAYHIGAWELHHDATLVDPAAAAQVSGELAHFMFWIREASAPIAVGVLTIALVCALIGYAVSALLWRWWLGSKWRERRQVRLNASS
jgi:uncharacterized protein (DUF2062 family)